MSIDGRCLLVCKDKLILGYARIGNWTENSPQIVIDKKASTFIVAVKVLFSRPGGKKFEIG